MALRQIPIIAPIEFLEFNSPLTALIANSIVGSTISSIPVKSLILPSQHF